MFRKIVDKLLSKLIHKIRSAHVKPTTTEKAKAGETNSTVESSTKLPDPTISDAPTGNGTLDSSTEPIRGDSGNQTSSGYQEHLSQLAHKFWVGRCCDLIFLRFSTIFGEKKLAFFSKNDVNTLFFCDFRQFSEKKLAFF
jgi:hypothetical protein